MGNVPRDNQTSPLLTLAAASNRGDHPVWTRNSAWWRKTYVERPAANLLQDALREIDLKGNYSCIITTDRESSGSISRPLCTAS